MREKTVSVNGTVYDSRTGMPLRVERGHDSPANHNAASVHATLQKSRTLNRKYVHREPSIVTPVATTPDNVDASSHAISVRTKRAVAPVTAARSAQITHFARPTTAAKKPVHSLRSMDIGPTNHRIAQHAQQRIGTTKKAATPAQPAAIKPSQVIKQEAIASALAQTPAKRTKKPVKQTHSRVQRLANIGTASLAILVLGAYLTYLSMPALSTRVAATQAGINASYPSYQPTGYSLSGPVAYQQGSVTMKFAANAGPEQYTLSQTRSEWDSTATLDNYVTPQAGKDYTTTTAGGLTIYRYADNAVWVNGGILYTISGNAALSNNQVQRIATSL